MALSFVFGLLIFVLNTLASSWQLTITAMHKGIITTDSFINTLYRDRRLKHGWHFQLNTYVFQLSFHSWLYVNQARCWLNNFRSWIYCPSHESWFSTGQSIYDAIEHFAQDLCQTENRQYIRLVGFWWFIKAEENKDRKKGTATVIRIPCYMYWCSVWVGEFSLVSGRHAVFLKIFSIFVDCIICKVLHTAHCIAKTWQP